MKALVPLDGSRFSRQILPYICRPLSPAQYELVLLHVAPLPEAYPARPPRPLVLSGWTRLEHESAWALERTEHPIYASQVWEGLRTMLLDSMASDVRCLKDSGFEVSVIVRFGEPAEEIADLVEEEDITLVAMATHGRTGLSRLIMGSVAERVLRSLDVPVLLIKPKEVDAEAQPLTLPYDMR